MTQSRELTNYCQESVRPSYSRRYAEALENIHIPEALDLIVRCIESEAESSCSLDSFKTHPREGKDSDNPYKLAISIIEYNL